MGLLPHSQLGKPVKKSLCHWLQLLCSLIYSKINHDTRLLFMYVTIQKAINLTGKSRSTISRYIKAGKLSTTEKGIDTTELIRVFGEFNQTGKPSLNQLNDTSVSERETWLMQQIEQLQKDMRELKQESIEREKRLMALLENQSSHDRSGGLFNKLFNDFLPR